ncbi:hypothetical protein nACB2_135 [Acinetobacter phage nACB2]|nr:hypothetical protein nACB2_135 [Acinetobacter phage nACB2]
MQLCLPEFIIDKIVEKGLSINLSEWNGRMDEKRDVFLKYKNSLSGVTHTLTGYINNDIFYLKNVKAVKE